MEWETLVFYIIGKQLQKDYFLDLLVKILMLLIIRL